MPFADPDDPSGSTKFSESVIAFDIEASCVSAIAEYTEHNTISGAILFGLGGVIEAASPAAMARQIEIYVDGFTS